MGTPKKKDVREKVLESPTLAEKIRLLEIGKEIGQGLNLEKLPDVLEEVREILLPLVPWLGKPLFSEGQFMNCPLPKIFQKKRAMLLLWAGFIKIWLERSGRWFLQLSDGQDTVYKEANSQELAETMLRKSGDFLKAFLRNAGFLEKEKTVFLKDIALYHALFLCILFQFFKNENAEA